MRKVGLPVRNNFPPRYYLKNPFISGRIINGLISVVGCVGVSPHGQDVQVGVTDPAHLDNIMSFINDVMNK